MIPGQALEIRYRRTDGRHYVHRFKPGVRMHTRRDGAVLLKGPRRIWADDRARGFARYLENPRRKDATMKDVMTYLLIGGLLWLWTRSSSAPSTAQQPREHWYNPTTGVFVRQLSLTPPGAGFRPASQYEVELFSSGGM